MEWHVHRIGRVGALADAEDTASPPPTPQHLHHRRPRFSISPVHPPVSVMAQEQGIWKFDGTARSNGVYRHVHPTRVFTNTFCSLGTNMPVAHHSSCPANFPWRLVGTTSCLFSLLPQPTYGTHLASFRNLPLFSLPSTSLDGFIKESKFRRKCQHISLVTCVFSTVHSPLASSLSPSLPQFPQTKKKKSYPTSFRATLSLWYKTFPPANVTS